jgi:RHS repeat-associated protein
VYFDNLQVVQTHGPIEEETHYYPYGLAMAGICDKAWGKQLNFVHLQGNEMQNQEFSDGTGLEEYDFNARYYDQQLGVWHAQDPAGQFASPYLAMGNNWPNGIDPNGKNFWSTLGTIGIIAGSAVAAYFTAGLSFDAESQFIIAGAVAVGGYAGASLESGSWNPGKWNGNAWKGAITGELIAASAAIGGEYATGEFADLTAGSAADIASIETGMATGVGQNIAMTEAAGLASTGKLSWNWDDMFVATTTGAVSGAFQSPGMQKFVDNKIWGGVSTSYFQGVTSNVIGGVISTSISGAAQKGWRGVFDISDQWPAAFGNALGQMSHQVLSDDESSALFGGKFTTKLISNYGNSFMQQAAAGINPFDITNISTSSFWNTFQGWTMDSLFPNVYQ